MSNPTHWIDAPAGDSPYIPKWARVPCVRRPNPLQIVDFGAESVRTEGIGSILARAGAPLRPETNPFVNQSLERSLQPALVPDPPSPAARALLPFNAAEILYGSIIGIVAGIAITLFTIGKVPPAASIELSDNSAAPFSARFEAVPERPL